MPLSRPIGCRNTGLLVMNAPTPARLTSLSRLTFGQSSWGLEGEKQEPESPTS